jgi:hypothetical protein
MLPDCIVVRKSLQEGNGIVHRRFRRPRRYVSLTSLSGELSDCRFSKLIMMD